MANEKSAFKLVVLVAAILALLFVAFLITKKTKKNAEEQAQSRQAVVNKVDVDFSKDPEKFPQEIPVEEGAEITQNYNATTPSGVFQATKVFETDQTLDANLELYTKFFNDNGWKVTATLNQPTFKMVSGEKDGKSIQVSIDENKVTKARTVSINYSESK